MAANLSMHFLSICALLFLANSIDSASIENPNSFMKLLSSTRSMANFGECDTHGMKCANCRTLRLCFPNDDGTYEKSEFDCSAMHPNTPYCNEATGMCTSKAEVCAIEPECYGKGYLPDPFNCRRYMMCVKVDGEYRKRIYGCDDTFAYDHAKTTCTEDHECYEFTKTNLCDGKENTIVVYPPDASIYAVCGKTNSELLIGQCPANHEFSLNSGSCKPACKDIGRIAHPDDHESFYECIKSGFEYIAVARKCPEGTKFNEKKQICCGCDCGNCQSGHAAVARAMIAFAAHGDEEDAENGSGEGSDATTTEENHDGSHEGSHEGGGGGGGGGHGGGNGNGTGGGCHGNGNCGSGGKHSGEEGHSGEGGDSGGNEPEPGDGNEANASGENGDEENGGETGDGDVTTTEGSHEGGDGGGGHGNGHGNGSGGGCHGHGNCGNGGGGKH